MYKKVDLSYYIIEKTPKDKKNLRKLLIAFISGILAFWLMMGMLILIIS